MFHYNNIYYHITHSTELSVGIWSWRLEYTWRVVYYGDNIYYVKKGCMVSMRSKMVRAKERDQASIEMDMLLEM